VPEIVATHEAEALGNILGQEVNYRRIKKKMFLHRDANG
jgi:hypothetical protein